MIKTGDWEAFVRGYLAAGDAGDFDALGTYLHDDVVVHDPGGSVTTGLDHEKGTWRKAREAMPGLRHELVDVVSDGSTLAARVMLSGTLTGRFAGISGQGQAFKIDQAIFMHLRDGRCQELWASLTRKASGGRWEHPPSERGSGAQASRSLPQEGSLSAQRTPPSTLCGGVQRRLGA